MLVYLQEQNRHSRPLLEQNLNLQLRLRPCSSQGIAPPQRLQGQLVNFGAPRSHPGARRNVVAGRQLEGQHQAEEIATESEATANLINPDSACTFSHFPSLGRRDISPHSSPSSPGMPALLL